MRFLLVHGWGFDSGVWEELLPLLSDCDDLEFVDLGFIPLKPRHEIVTVDSRTVAIGHSLGVMWLLKHMPAPPRAFVSINGFARFLPPVPRESLLAMQQGLDVNPLAQMKHFWRSCKASPFAQADKLDVPRLREGLDWLMNWDATAELAELPCPRLVLAAKNDAVVSQAMSREQWGEDVVVWSDRGGHLLLRNEAEWCAEKIGEFVARL